MGAVFALVGFARTTGVNLSVDGDFASATPRSSLGEVDDDES
eukprot:COSAG05_NODE_4047_length_1700_cov_1.296065_2_plen_41_part_01